MVDKNIQKDYMIRKAFAMYAYISVHDCNDDIVTNAACIQDYIIKLCKLLDVERIDDIKIVKTDYGHNIVQLIDGSVITGIFVDELSCGHLDIVACKPFTPAEVCEFTKTFFEAQKSNYLFNFRS